MAHIEMVEKGQCENNKSKTQNFKILSPAKTLDNQVCLTIFHLLG